MCACLMLDHCIFQIYVFTVMALIVICLRGLVEKQGESIVPMDFIITIIIFQLVIYLIILRDAL